MYEKKIKNTLLYLLPLLILAFLFLLNPIVFSTAADDGSCGKSLEWELDGGHLIISGSGDMTEYTEENLPPWFESRKDISVITLPDGLTSIGKFAFYECTSVKGISLPSTLTAIGDWSFAKCRNLEYVNAPASLKSIGESAFQECESLTTLRLSEGITTIKDRAFYMCSSLRSMTVPSSVTEFGTAVFAWCDGLIYLDFKAQITSLPVWSFYNCSSLDAMNLSSTISSVGNEAFKGCDKLSSVYYPSEEEGKWEWLQGEIEDDNSIFAGTGSVNNFYPNDSGISGDYSNGSFENTKVSESENASVSITTGSKYDKDSTNTDNAEKTSTIISATIDNTDGWNDLKNLVNEELSKQEDEENPPKLLVNVQIGESEISKDKLKDFVGKNLELKITTAQGSSWIFDMSSLKEGDLKKHYNLGYIISPVNPDDTKIKSNSVYQLDFDKALNLNSQFSVFVGTENAYQLATLYKKKAIGYEELQTVIIDANGNVWFNMDSVAAGDDYFVGINSEGVSQADAVVANNSYASYDYDEDSYLTDQSGARYMLGERSSKWGISGKRFAIYVAIAVGFLVIVVACIMITMNKLEKSKAKYKRRP